MPGTVRLGDSGDDVRRVQRVFVRSKQLGPTDLDGLFGSRTDQAVREFQQSAGLMVDGIVGPLTWAQLPAYREAFPEPVPGVPGTGGGAAPEGAADRLRLCRRDRRGHGRTHLAGPGRGRRGDPGEPLGSDPLRSSEPSPLRRKLSRGLSRLSASAFWRTASLKNLSWKLSCDCPMRSLPSRALPPIGSALSPALPEPQAESGGDAATRVVSLAGLQEAPTGQYLRRKDEGTGGSVRDRQEPEQSGYTGLLICKLTV